MVVGIFSLVLGILLAYAVISTTNISLIDLIPWSSCFSDPYCTFIGGIIVFVYHLLLVSVFAAPIGIGAWILYSGFRLSIDNKKGSAKRVDQATILSILPVLIFIALIFMMFAIFGGMSGPF